MLSGNVIGQQIIVALFPILALLKMLMLCNSQALDYLRKSRGIERTKELAWEHVDRAIKAIEALPDSDDEDVLTSRRALIDITERVITRTK
jgi:geranylgeranyl pyrophosphate synthase